MRAIAAAQPAHGSNRKRVVWPELKDWQRDFRVRWRWIIDLQCESFRFGQR